jgi:hypothetical protein
MANKPERINMVCQQSSQLNYLTKRVQQLDKLNLVIQETLPEQFSGHCQLANIVDDRIIILTDNAAFASLIRFQAPTLCKTVSAFLPNSVTKLEVKVRPYSTLSSSSHTTTMTLSNFAANALQQTANIIEDGTLKSALEKLAKRSENLASKTN